MLQTEVFNKNVEAYEAWYDNYPEVFQSEVAAIKEQLLKLPEKITGIEVGLGTGRFSEALGIKEGIEPSEEMAIKAMKRGIEIMKGVAEKLPYSALHFDFVLFVTICHLNNIKTALNEAYRVLKPGGSILIAFLDKEQSIAQQYEEKRYRSTFFQNATYYSVNKVETLLKDAKFKDLEFNQTLFGELDEIKSIQAPKEGYGEGSFVVVKAVKK
ncbi:class I SAM-dependent methyltransferase [Flaviramulus sp. BrNp1-15]|uniref:class I SAM-dependent methyltransferase n=1 Tax=Flaviramulus sp. BrNp1-15 TaxID=2916754 RepID=UPI001EE8C2D8|nr:class I SAM-dependent methyltransferase [Flaviramulus sp. BrNp1-15]ULC58186.1 class I SAM-dependent methyltransferase [Flaviramulus sp. BrNp1-15]